MKLSKQTTERMRVWKAKGYTIIIGNNRNLSKSKKWQGHGWPVRTVWAVKPNNTTIQGG